MTPAQKTALEWAIAHLTDDGAHRLAPVHMATIHSLLSSSDEVTRLQARVTELEDGIRNYSPTPKQINVLLGMACRLVTSHLKRCGVDPFSKKGYKLLGDSADWIEDIDEAVIAALDDGGFVVFAEEAEWIRIRALKASLGIDQSQVEETPNANT